MRLLTRLLITAIAVQGLAPLAASAQSRGESRGGEYRYAADACGSAVQGEVRNRYPQAYGVRLVTKDPAPGGRPEETQVRGQGEFDDRNGGIARFNYGCTFNGRTGATYALDVRDVRPVADPRDRKKDNSAAIAGLVLGAIVVGAIAASADDDRDRDRDRDRYRQRRGDFSPEPGVVCNAREASCWKDGRYSERWSRRIFVR
jgi:hypothetical protein